MIDNGKGDCSRIRGFYTFFMVAAYALVWLVIPELSEPGVSSHEFLKSTMLGDAGMPALIVLMGSLIMMRAPDRKK